MTAFNSLNGSENGLDQFNNITSTKSTNAVSNLHCVKQPLNFGHLRHTQTDFQNSYTDIQNNASG